MRRLRVVLAALALALVGADAAAAETVVLEDREGRSITFDVQAPSVDVEWYAELLRGALHGDEISRVTIRIAVWRDVQSQCGSGAAACYSERRGGAVIVVPAGQGRGLAATLIHEYGHHVDATRPVDGAREPNGTPGWFAARGMAQLLADGAVTRSYRLGWERSVAEVFAEDYVQLHLETPYRISWLERPSEAVKAAIAADLGGPAPAPIDLPEAEEDRAPVVVVRSGTLRPSQRRTLPFGLLGPGRRVTFTASVGGAHRAGVRARIDVVCNGRTVASQALGRGRQRATIDRRNLGPADCDAVLRSTSAATLRYVLRLRLAIEGQGQPPAA